MANTLIPSLCYLRVKDTTGKLVTLITFWISLEITRVLNDAGNFTIALPADNVNVSHFGLDYQVELRRSVDGILAEYTEFEGLVRFASYSVAEDGSKIFTVKGTCYNGLLARRQIAYNPGTIRADKNAPAETVMKEYVVENCGCGATTVNGRENDGAFPGFYVEGSYGRGITWSGSKSYLLLLDVIKDIAASTKVDFQVVGSGPAEFTFHAYPDRLGKDRSFIDVDKTSYRNKSGNTPTIFSDIRGNLTSVEHIVDASSEATVCYVLGKGAGSTRHIITVMSTAYADSPWNVIEVTRSGSSQSFEYQLQQLGADVLSQKRRRDIVNLAPQQTENCVYGRDFSLGDYISIIKPDTGTMAHKRITYVRLSFSDKSERIELKFEDR